MTEKLNWTHGVIGDGTPLRQNEWTAGPYQIVESPSGSFDLRRGAFAVRWSLGDAMEFAQAHYDAGRTALAKSEGRS